MISAKPAPSVLTRAFRPGCDRNWSLLPGTGAHRFMACPFRASSNATASAGSAWIALLSPGRSGNTREIADRIADGLRADPHARARCGRQNGAPPGTRTRRSSAVNLPPYCCLGGLPAGRWLFVSSGHDQDAGPVVGTGANGVQRGTAHPVVVTAQQQVRRSRASVGGWDDDRDHRPGRAAAGPVGVADGPGRSRRRIAGRGGTIAVMVREPAVHEATAQGGGTDQ